MTDTARIQIEVTQEQAHAIAKALDTYTRICIGQFDFLADLFRDGTISIARRSSEEGERVLASPQQCNRIEELLNAIKAEIGHPSNGSNGIGHPDVSITAHRSYETYKALSQVLANLRDPNPMLRGVSYDGLLVRYTDDPAPKVSVN